MPTVKKKQKPRKLSTEELKSSLKTLEDRLDNILTEIDQLKEELSTRENQKRLGYIHVTDAQYQQKSDYTRTFVWGIVGVDSYGDKVIKEVVTEEDWTEDCVIGNTIRFAKGNRRLFVLVDPPKLEPVPEPAPECMPHPSPRGDI